MNDAQPIMVPMTPEKPRKPIPVYVRGELFGWLWPNEPDERTRIDIELTEILAANAGAAMADKVNAAIFGE